MNYARRSAGSFADCAPSRGFRPGEWSYSVASTARAREASATWPQASTCARNRWHRPSMISRATGWSPGAPTRPTDAVAFIELTTSGHELLQTTPAQRETCLTKALEDELDANERPASCLRYRPNAGAPNRPPRAPASW